jgi:CPA2 family monovalent cation:H+ antiporter-2
MAVYLPLVAVLLLGQGPAAAVLSVALALAAVGAVLFVAVRFGNALSRLVAHESDEVLLFSTLGLVLLVAGVAQRLSVSAAVGAFLVGIAWSDPVAERSFKLVGPLRDLFAALFFFFFGLEVNPATLLPVLWPAAVLGAVTAATKVLTGWWAARRAGADLRSGLQAGTVLVARGEFSIVIAGLGVSAGLEPALGALAAAYVLLLAALGPLAAHFTGPLTRGLKRTPPRLGRRPS